MAAQLITVQEARTSLRLGLDVDDPDTATDLELWMSVAEADVLRFVERIDTGWTAETVPLEIKAAILHELVHMWEHRGDEDQGEARSPSVRSLLRMLRDPALA